MIFFLTDGMPNSGEVTSPTAIADALAPRMVDKMSLYSIAIGDPDRLNFDFLTRLSLNAGGRIIWISREYPIEIQLVDFFAQINDPLLYNVQFVYGPEIRRETLTKTKFPQVGIFFFRLDLIDHLGVLHS